MTYNRWKAMLQRTRLPAGDQRHASYAGRGITVCNRWLKFVNFLADMGECPDTRMTLDRIDNAKGYEPGNCRWATIEQQNANRSSCLMLTHEGITLTATDWAQRIGMRPGTLIQRLALGWTPERAITTPVKKRREPRK